MESDRARWDARYADGDTTDVIAPEALSSCLDIDSIVPTDGRALDLACGVGAQSMWLAARGLNVLSLDVSPKAIELVRDAAMAAGFDERVEARVHDTDEGLPADATGFDVVVCQRFRVPALYSELVKRLAPGGVLCLTVLSAVGLDAEPGPFHAPAGELADAFGPMRNVDIIRQVEADGVASIVVRRRND